MKRLDWLAGLAILCIGLPASAGDAFRFSAPITVQQTAAFVQLPLPVSAYAHSLQSGLQDLRIIDARGERVPFTVLMPRASHLQTTEQLRDATLYALPAKPPAGGAWPSPVEVIVENGRVRVKLSGTAGLGTTGAMLPVGRPPGWLFDLGERAPQSLSPQLLRLLWSGPTEFSASFDYEMSDDLRTWRSGGSGQLMALASAAGPLTQPNVVLPSEPGRFIRLIWTGTDAVPTLIGAKVIFRQPRSVALDAPSDLQFAPSPEPQGKRAFDEISKRALHFDLGGALPLAQINLQLAPGTHVTPARLQGRTHVDEPWRDLVHSVFYQLERGTVTSTSPPVPLQATVRYVRVIPDERAALLDTTQTRLAVQAQLAHVVFAMQGQAPFTLLAGAVNSAPSALPAATLIPDLENERARFGKATLGGWNAVAAVVRQAEAEKRQAELRPWLLWTVLLAGVAGLGFMVWRLARGAAT